MATDISKDGVVRNLLDSFTDRERILTQIRQLLRLSQPNEFRLLAIKGNSGTGKTFLIEYLSKRVCPSAGWQTGTIAFAHSFPDFRMILDELEDALKVCVPHESLKSYRMLRDAYKRSFDEYHTSITINQNVDAKDAASVSNIRMEASVNVELHQRELQLRAELTRALLELAEEREHPLCLFIDGYERLMETDAKLENWLWEEVLLKLSQHTIYPLLVVTCGWKHPLSPVLQPFSIYDELDDFDLSRVKDYLQAHDIIPRDTSPLGSLVTSFYALSQGHPLVLSLAVTYFQTLSMTERTAESLHMHRSLITEEARVQWLEERLLKRLPEPYRTMLERGPILRSFNQSALKALLQLEGDKQDNVPVLDDRIYASFLNYPFINRKNVQGDELLISPTFHDLTRKVRVETLRRLHPETKQRLHRAVVKYYDEMIEAEQQRNPIHQIREDNNYLAWFAGLSEQTFSIWVEWLYHALQIKETQSETFDIWIMLVGAAVNRWRYTEAKMLLDLVRQLVEEKEPFLDKQSSYYGQYLIWYSRYLEQEVHLDEALLALEEAVQVFERRKHITAQADCFNNIGGIYHSLGQLETALRYYQQALTIRKQINDVVEIARLLNSISGIHHSLRQFDIALDYANEALALRKQIGDSAAIGISLNNISFIYCSLGQFDVALNYANDALAIKEQIGDPAEIATSLNNIGHIHFLQKQLDTALVYALKSLPLREQVGNSLATARCLNNIGKIYILQDKCKDAIPFFLRSVGLYEQMGNGIKPHMASALEKLAVCYLKLGDIEKAVSFHERATQIRSQLQKN